MRIAEREASDKLPNLAISRWRAREDAWMRLTQSRHLLERCDAFVREIQLGILDFPGFVQHLLRLRHLPRRNTRYWRGLIHCARNSRAKHGRSQEWGALKYRSRRHPLLVVVRRVYVLYILFGVLCPVLVVFSSLDGGSCAITILYFSNFNKKRIYK